MDLIGLTPPELQEVVFFLLPGILFVWLFFFQIPDRRKSGFLTVVLSVVISVLMTFVTELLYVFVDWITNLNTSICKSLPFFRQIRQMRV